MQLFSQADIINIGYAKTAKRVDVKRLKAAMWNILKTLPKDSVTDDDATDKVSVWKVTIVLYHLWHSNYHVNKIGIPHQCLGVYLNFAAIT